MKFKAGDRVVLDTNASINRTLGASHTYLLRDRTLTVKKSTDIFTHLEGMEEAFYTSRFKLAPDVTIEDAPVTEFIIMLHSDGMYRPATEPRKFGSKAQAIKVAQVMAEKHGGRFVVFQTVADAVMPVKKAKVREYNAA